jgi:hypothetical protein
MHYFIYIAIIHNRVTPIFNEKGIIIKYLKIEFINYYL